jgi:hypothetical protein
MSPPRPQRRLVRSHLRRTGERLCFLSSLSLASCGTTARGWVEDVVIRGGLGNPFLGIVGTGALASRDAYRRAEAREAAGEEQRWLERFASIHDGLSLDEVTALIGLPTSRKESVTNNVRTETWYYEGAGRITFSTDAVGAERVTSIDHDPSEPGYGSTERGQ